AMLAQLGVRHGAPILVAGSTHAGEEAVLAPVFLKLRFPFPRPFLVVVPPHFESSPEGGRELESLRLRLAYRPALTNNVSFSPGEIDCLLVNTPCERRYFYEPATVIFIGKSLTAHGGQNPIEPGALGKAMVFGPNMENFADVARSFLAREAALQVQN